MDKRERLLQILVEKSFLVGDFTLASGRKSTYFLDFKATASDPEGIALTGELIFDAIRNMNHTVDAVGGAIFGAAPIVTAVQMVSYREGAPLPGFFVRKQPKDHGTQKYVEGHLPSDRAINVIMIDDVITTAGSLLRATEHLKAGNPRINVVGVMALVDREEGGSENIIKAGYELTTIFSIKDLWRMREEMNRD